MFGWTLLLIWAAREPVARKDIALLTAVPVLPGLALSVLYGCLNGYIPLSSSLQIWSSQAFLFALLISGYIRDSRHT